jgi:hypothetical protein
MTDLTSVEIPKPKDWQAFERHCRLLATVMLGPLGMPYSGGLSSLEKRYL